MWRPLSLWWIILPLYNKFVNRRMIKLLIIFWILSWKMILHSRLNWSKFAIKSWKKHFIFLFKLIGFWNLIRRGGMKALLWKFLIKCLLSVGPRRMKTLSIPRNSEMILKNLQIGNTITLGIWNLGAIKENTLII